MVATYPENARLISVLYSSDYCRGYAVATPFHASARQVHVTGLRFSLQTTLKSKSTSTNCLFFALLSFLRAKFLRNAGWRKHESQMTLRCLLSQSITRPVSRKSLQSCGTKICRSRHA